MFLEIPGYLIYGTFPPPALAGIHTEKRTLRTTLMTFQQADSIFLNWGQRSHKQKAIPCPDNLCRACHLPQATYSSMAGEQRLAWGELQPGAVWWEMAEVRAAPYHTQTRGTPGLQGQGAAT